MPDHPPDPQAPVTESPTVPTVPTVPTLSAPALPTTRWEAGHTPESWQEYADRFARLHEDGTDVDGEARFVDAMAARGSTILDAGCGTGRVAAALHARGHRVIGVDRDAGLVEIAQARYPEVRYLQADLLGLTAGALRAAAAPSVFDLIVVPGNVLVYLAPGTEGAVLRRLRRLLEPDGRLVAGFATDREYTVQALDRDAAAAGFGLEYRFATWHLDPLRADSPWAVSVLRATTVLW